MFKEAVTKVKFKRLKRRLGLRQWQAVGILEAMWLTTYANAPAGDIGRCSNEDIAAELEWDGDADELIAALVECGWLDADPEFRLIVHDWSIHCSNQLKGGFAKSGRLFADQAAKHRAKHPAKQTPCDPSLAPSLADAPNLTIPNQTGPQPVSADADNESPGDPESSPNQPAPPAVPPSPPTKPADVRAEDLPVPLEIDTPKFRETWLEWIRFRRKKRHSVDEVCMRRQLETLRKLGVADAVACIELALTNGYQGLPADRFRNGKQGKFTVGPGQRYDPEAGKHDPNHGVM